MGLLGLSAMREALAALPGGTGPPPTASCFTYGRRGSCARGMDGLARPLAPLAAGAGLDKAVLRIRLPERPRHGAARRRARRRRHGAGAATGTGADPAVDSLPAEAATARRLGAPYPYEIVRMLTRRRTPSRRFPAGRFVEHDLDEQGDLVRCPARTA